MPQMNSGLITAHSNLGRNRDLLTIKDKERISRVPLQTMPSSTKKKKVVNGRGESQLVNNSFVIKHKSLVTRKAYRNTFSQHQAYLNNNLSIITPFKEESSVNQKMIYRRPLAGKIKKFNLSFNQQSESFSHGQTY